jgi:peptide subunit release factor 1 (eRF1)
MNDLGATLSDLARLRSGSEPIVSLYLDVHWRDEHQRERVRLFVQERARAILGHYADRAPGRDGLARTLGRIQEFVAGLAAQAYEADRNGLALFACEALRLWRPLFFGRQVENELSVNGTPHLTKLVRLVEEVAPAIVVVPIKEGADIYEVRLGDLDVEGSVRGFVPRSDTEKFNAGTGKPGRHYEREKKNERREENFAHKNRRLAAEEVTSLFDRTPGARVVLVGTAEGMAAFERELPPRVAEQIVARVPRPREWDSADGVRRDGVKALAELVLARERDEETRQVDAVIGQALRGALAVVGPEDVVLAVNEGRVHTLVVEEDFARTGFRCDNCDALGGNVEAAEVCPFCGGDLRAVPHLREALVARTLASGGRVEVVPHGNKLHSYRGVAAVLRQTAPTGLRGASPPWPTAPGASQG